MSEPDFDLRIRHIEEQYAARREGAEAYRDQEVARLFEECGWSQDKIARHMSKKVPWVSRRLCFGRFLKEFPTGKFPATTNLTERRFREHYKSACRAFPGKQQSREKERDRFAHVLNALQNGVPQGAEALGKNFNLTPSIRSVLSDGGWHTIEQIAADIEDSVVGVTETQIRNAVNQLLRGGSVVSKKVGKIAQYRAVRGKAAAKSPAAVTDLYERVAPLIDELDQIGQRSEYAISPIELRMIAVKLRRLFDSVLHGAAT